MMYRIFAAAMAAGLLAAVLISMVEVFTTTPMILAAETIENSPAVAHDSAKTATVHVHDVNAWTPKNGLERFLFTVLANTVTSIAFSLLVIVGLTMGERKADLSKGILLALAGFTAFTLAPVMGLPPELPGSPTSDLQLRQIWWACTVALTLGGLYCIFIPEAAPIKLLGVILLIAPHVWGAPHPATHDSEISAIMSAHFAASSIVVSALLWGLIGFFAPLFHKHFKGKEA